MLCCAISGSLSTCSGDYLTELGGFSPGSSTELLFTQLCLLVLTVPVCLREWPTSAVFALDPCGSVWLESISCSHSSIHTVFAHGREVSWWGSDCFRKWFWVELHFFIFHLFLACGLNIREKLLSILTGVSGILVLGSTWLCLKVVERLKGRRKEKSRKTSPSYDGFLEDFSPSCCSQSNSASKAKLALLILVQTSCLLSKLFWFVSTSLVRRWSETCRVFKAEFGLQWSTKSGPSS